MRWHSLPVAAAILMMVDAPALACTYPLAEKRAGESEADHARRQDRFLRDWSEQGSRAWQGAQFDLATRVSLARIVSQRETGGASLPVSGEPVAYESVAQPIASLKGPLSKAPVAVRVTQQMGCRIFERGSAARASAGSLVILFEQDLGGTTFGEGFALDRALDPRILAALKAVPANLKRAAP